MASYISGIQRNQLVLFPTSLDDLISPDNDVRVIDAFVDSLDLASFNFLFSNPSSKGNRPYNPSDLLKLFLFGYKQGIRSSRKLMYQSKNNIEYIWLLKGISPDFRTISDFRKNNIDSLKSIMFQFNLSCKNLNIISNIFSQDGTKIKAVNSKDNNFTLSKIDDRKKHIEQHISEYLEASLLTDQIEDKTDSIQVLKDKLELLNSYEKQIVSSGSSQISLTDSDSRLMKDNGKMSVSYNDQVCVDSNSHLVLDFELSSNPADLGSMSSISSNIKQTYGFDKVTNITDKGYVDREDMIHCLENGVIPAVTPLSKQDDSFLLEDAYEPTDISQNMINSTNVDDIKSCLKSGVIPNIYKDDIESIDIKECVVYEEINDDNDELNNLTEEQIRDLAMKENCFTKSISTDKVYCPMGEILRKKSKNKNKCRYCNKLACKNCKNPCTKSEFRTVEFKEKQVIVFPKNSKQKTNKKKRKKKIVKKVIIKLKVNKDLLHKRMAISEHPHASMKFWDNSRYLLLKGKRMATGECALYYCAYNIRRAINILGANKLIEYFNNNKSIKMA